jgi:hypothetical protein
VVVVVGRIGSDVWSGFKLGDCVRTSAGSGEGDGDGDGNGDVGDIDEAVTGDRSPVGEATTGPVVTVTPVAIADATSKAVQTDARNCLRVNRGRFMMRPSYRLSMEWIRYC